MTSNRFSLINCSKRRRKKSDDTATKATEAKAAVVEDAEVVEETKVEETKAVAKEETPVAKADSNEEGKDKD